MKLTTIIIALFLTLQTAAQPLTVVRDLLTERKFQPFKSYIDTAPKSNITFYWEALREVTPSYWEGVVRIEEFQNANDGTGGNRIYNYRIDFLATEQNIFFYRFNQIHNKKIGEDRWEPYDTTFNAFTDKGAYTAFESSFSKTYNEKLNPKELFITSLVYGGACGIAGTPPEYQQKLVELLREKDEKMLLAWLKSPNTEKQLYAVSGFKTLQQNGYKLTEEEKRIIEVINEKQGTVSTCGGCIFSSDTIKNVVENINSSKGIYVSNATSKSRKTVYYGLATLLLIVAALIFYLRRRTKGGVQHAL